MKDRAGTYKNCCITCANWGVESEGEFNLRRCKIINKDTKRNHSCDKYNRCGATISMLSRNSSDDRYKDVINYYKG